jgi:uncharacterized protein YegP (UPF0339 family)
MLYFYLLLKPCIKVSYFKTTFMAGKFQIFKGILNNQFYYRLRSSNNEIILSGEGYVTKEACVKGILSVKSNAPFDHHYLRKDATGNYTFNLKAGNGEIIGRSENYTTVTARENGIDAVKREALKAQIEDNA